jgi:hypothetical protein
MHLRPYTVLTTNYWLPMDVAAEYAGVSVDMLVDAITGREVRASVTHPERRGDWMVPIADLDNWLGRRVRARVSG